MSNPEEEECEKMQVNVVSPCSVHLGRVESVLGLISRCLFVRQKRAGKD